MRHPPLFLAALVVTVGPGLLASDMLSALSAGAHGRRAHFSIFAQICRPWGEPYRQRPHQAGRVQGVYGVFRV